MGDQPDPCLLRDVIEEHLSELAFCFEKLSQGHSHPLITLADLAAGAESRLLAHSDGLVLAGSDLVRDLTRSLFADLGPRWPSDANAAAAVFALVRSGLIEDVVPFFEHESPLLRIAAARGASLAESPDLARLAIQRVSATGGADIGSGWLEYLGLRGIQPENLFAPLTSKSTELISAALLALRSNSAPAFLPTVQRLAEGDVEILRERALSLLLAWGVPAAWTLCESQALNRERAFPFSMMAYAMLGGRKEHQQLAASRQIESHRIHVLRALGMSGNPEVVSLLLDHVASDVMLEAKVAAQSISAIAGLDLRDDTFASTEPEVEPDSLPPLEEDDLDADLVPPPEAALPRPDAVAIRQGWTRTERTMPPTTKYVRGQPLTPSSLLDVLETGPLGLRHAWTIELALRTGGQTWLASRALSDEQRKAIGTARSTIARFAPNRFSTW